MTEELKPCPFCGRKTTIDALDHDIMCYLRRRYTAPRGNALTYEQLKSLYNHRPVEDALKSAFRWIPVSEKLPEPGRPVLVLDATVTPPQFAMAEHGDWPLLATDTFGMTITHWAAMPPLPEKDG